MERCPVLINGISLLARQVRTVLTPAPSAAARAESPWINCGVIACVDGRSPVEATELLGMVLPLFSKMPERYWQPKNTFRRPTFSRDSLFLEEETWAVFFVVNQGLHARLYLVQTLLRVVH